MIANPIALLGLLAIAVPILIHLLGRHQSRIERFPTLRFIGVSRLVPTRRRRISDWLLLLVRCAIVAFAALALSQPVFTRTSTAPSQVTRVTIVDTSLSVNPPSPGLGMEIRTDSPSDAIPGAVAWLETQPGLREIAIVSDFQRSSIDSAAIAAIPQEIGIVVIPSASVIPSPSTSLGVDSARDLYFPDVSVLAGASDLAGATVAWRAVGRPTPTDTPTRIAIIYRGHPAADSLRAAAQPVDSMWMARIVASVERDPAYAAVARDSITIGRNGSQLSFFVRTDAGSLASAALNHALIRATTNSVPASELDSAHWTAAELANWKRAPTPSPSSTLALPPSPRWVWLVVLMLLALETWVRSRRKVETAAELLPAQDRAA